VALQIKSLLALVLLESFRNNREMDCITPAIPHQEPDRVAPER
jgi:hypothetical protein